MGETIEVTCRQPEMEDKGEERDEMVCSHQTVPTETLNCKQGVSKNLYAMYECLYVCEDAPCSHMQPTVSL